MPDREAQAANMDRAQADPAEAPQALELAVADPGTFTRATERMFIAQPPLSRQIRRLKEMVSTPLLQRRRKGLRLTEAGAVLPEESRSVLSLVDHGVSFPDTARPVHLSGGDDHE
jgi:DNA-binding transcriptional LysR family regulator